MSRLQQLCGLVNGISSDQEARKLVSSWLPHQAEAIEKGGFGCAPGVKNCALIAEFVLVYMHSGVLNYTALVHGRLAKEGANVPYSGGDRDVILVELPGHNIAVVREENQYALFQAWDGKFHVFPKLNDKGAGYNEFGTGKAAIQAIDERILDTYLKFSGETALKFITRNTNDVTPGMAKEYDPVKRK